MTRCMLNGLIVWPENYNRGDVEAIALSIRHFGFNNAPRIWRDVHVRANNHTVLALRLIQSEGARPGLDHSYPPQNVHVDNGAWSIDTVDISHLSESEAVAFAIADNEIARSSVRDDRLLLEYLESMVGDVRLAVGFDDSALNDLRALVDDMSADEAKRDAPAVSMRGEELVAKYDVQPGDLWLIASQSVSGTHRLVCGDATQSDDVCRAVDNSIASMLLTSPPYNAGSSESLSGNTHTDNTKYVAGGDDALSVDDYLRLLIDFTQSAIPYARWLFINIQSLAGNKLALIDYLYTFKAHYADTLIWSKDNAQPAMAERVINSGFEYVHVLSQSKYPTRAIGTKDFRGTVDNVFAAPAQRQNEFADLHAATMPLDVAGHLITNFTNRGERVLDPFCGTGTTIVACESRGRLGSGVELSPVYVACTLERLTLMGLTVERGS